LSALPTQPAQGLPVALPPPLPLPDADPSRVEQYGPFGHWPLAPPVLESALLIGCGFVRSADPLFAVPLEDFDVPTEDFDVAPEDRELSLDEESVCVDVLPVVVASWATPWLVCGAVG